MVVVVVVVVVEYGEEGVEGRSAIVYILQNPHMVHLGFFYFTGPDAFGICRFDSQPDRVDSAD